MKDLWRCVVSSAPSLPDLAVHLYVCKTALVSVRLVPVRHEAPRGHVAVKTFRLDYYEYWFCGRRTSRTVDPVVWFDSVALLCTAVRRQR